MVVLRLPLVSSEFDAGGIEKDFLRGELYYCCRYANILRHWVPLRLINCEIKKEGIIYQKVLATLGASNTVW